MKKKKNLKEIRIFRQVGIKVTESHHLLDDDPFLLDLLADFDFACGIWASKSAPYAPLFAPFIVGGGWCADPPGPPAP